MAQSRVGRSVRVRSGFVFGIAFAVVFAVLGGACTLAPEATPTPAPTKMGPEAFSIGTGHGGKDIDLTIGQRVDGGFTIAGADVYCKVLDPGGNIVLSKDVKSSQGQFVFIAAQTGTYRIQFISTGILTPSVVTLNWTIYWK